jgi:MFS transporter, DHA1 family, multidrug resistance protein
MGPRELVAFLAMSISLSALGVAMLLPAFGALRLEFGLAEGSTEIAGFVTAYFAGLAIGQLSLGLLSDRFGRRPLLVAGFIISLVGAALSAVAPSLSLLFLARVLWGIGSAGGRVLSIAIVRDQFAGSVMARKMSFILAVFLIVPVIAPSIGALGLQFVTWRQLIGLNVLAALSLLIWVRRFDETLPRERRRPFRFAQLRTSLRVITRHPRSGPLIVAQAVLFGGFASYLATSELIYTEVFGRAELFPLLFGLMAVLMGTASVLNGRFVVRVGLPTMLRATLTVYLIGASLLVLLALVTGGRPTLGWYLAALGLVLTSHATLLPNMTARAMEPMGRIAGSASAINGSVLVGGGGLIGALIDRQYDTTVLPLAVALLLIGVLSAVLLRLSEREASEDAATD